jgi:hypothetical protein
VSFLVFNFQVDIYDSAVSTTPSPLMRTRTPACCVSAGKYTRRLEALPVEFELRDPANYSQFGKSCVASVAKPIEGMMNDGSKLRIMHVHVPKAGGMYVAFHPTPDHAPAPSVPHIPGVNQGSPTTLSLIDGVHFGMCVCLFFSTCLPAALASGSSTILPQFH